MPSYLVGLSFLRVQHQASPLADVLEGDEADVRHQDVRVGGWEEEVLLRFVVVLTCIQRLEVLAGDEGCLLLVLHPEYPFEDPQPLAQHVAHPIRPDAVVLACLCVDHEGVLLRFAFPRRRRSLLGLVLLGPHLLRKIVDVAPILHDVHGDIHHPVSCLLVEDSCQGEVLHLPHQLRLFRIIAHQLLHSFLPFLIYNIYFHHLPHRPRFREFPHLHFHEFLRNE